MPSKHLLSVLFSIAVVACSRDAVALDLLYTFEGDGGGTATDKLTDDGGQNGTVYQNVYVDDTFVVPFGSQSAFFDLPAPGIAVPPYSTLEIPDTTFGEDFSLTLAAFIRNDEDPQNFTRAFSSYKGTSAVSPERILLDFDSRESGNVPGIRAIVNNTVVQTTAPPTGMADPGYHHYALTINAGDVAIYFDGQEVATGNVGSGYTNTMNIFVGEDPHDGGGSANEQLIGNVDDVLVLGRALSATDIASLASGMAASSVVTPAGSELAVYYDFEGDSGMSATDRFESDGAQNGMLTLNSSVDTDPANAALGSSSATFNDPREGNPEVLHSVIDVGAVGNLGSTFTFSAVVNPLDGGQGGGGFARIFSTYPGGGGTAGRFILDFNPYVAEGGIGTRLILPDGTIVQTDVAPLVGETSTVTAVYDKGDVRVYLNGVEIASGTSEASLPIDLGEFPLRIGEDSAGAVNENFVGNMDDVMVLSRALTADQVASLHAIGASALLPMLPPAPVLDGDYNDDGIVDAADYTVWRDSLGATGEGLAADGNGDAVVDGSDFAMWKANFGSVGASVLTGPSAAAVPEPATLWLVLAPMALFAARQACRRAQRTGAA